MKSQAIKRIEVEAETTTMNLQLYPTIERCPYCYKPPVITLKENSTFWVGGCETNLLTCEALLKNIVLQPNYESAVNQWNYMVEQRKAEKGA